MEETKIVSNILVLKPQEKRSHKASKNNDEVSRTNI
jgi:hypothetical protein